ncbi:MAG TPA: acetyltransferase [Xanthomonadaceae bacterium]|nr:acetyltransferase [Xanthomonadaceae bacterium]
MQPRKLILVGDSAFAEIAYEYFTHDSDYEVVAFAVESAYLKRTELFGLPVVSFETLEQHFAPTEHVVHVAVTYGQMNRVRARLMAQAKAKGYPLASYISSNAFIWRNVRLGEHVFIFEDNTIQPFVTLGDGVVLWSGNHIGHHSRIGDYVFVSSHVVISGFCEIGARSFLGVNCTLFNNVNLGEDNWVSPGVIIGRSAGSGLLYKASPSEPAVVSSLKFFKVAE